MASRAVGDGGRGAGFMACATTRGIVGILHDEMTGSTERKKVNKIKDEGLAGQHTRVISINCSLHDRLHPLANDRLLIRTEEVRWFVMVMVNSESITTRIQSFVHGHFVPINVEVSL